VNVGAEDRKKVGILVALMVAAGVLFYINSGSDSPAPSAGNASAAVRSTDTPSIPPLTPVAATKSTGRKISRRIAGDEFKPSLKVKPEDAADLARIDPTLRLDLLAKVQGVERTGNGRNLFQFGAAPPPPADPAPSVKVVPGAKPGTPGSAAAEAAAAAKPAGPPPAPQAPPIPLKFYGFTEPRTAGTKRAFFLEGEDIHVASEGDTIKKRYKVIRISPGSVVMEDTQFKQQQTLVIQQEVG
jgi:hypothetical protein